MKKSLHRLLYAAPFTGKLKKNVFSLIFLLFPLLCFPPAGKAVLGVITDPSLFAESEDFPSKLWAGYWAVEFTRDIRVSEEQFLSSNQQGGIFDSLYMKSDFKLGYSLDFSFLQNSPLFSNMEVVFIVSYKRLLYATVEEIQKTCWHSVLCFSDMQWGVLKSFFITDRLLLEPSFYVHIPFSKSSFDKSLVSGVTVGLNTAYKVWSQSDGGGGRFSIVSRHFINRDFYLYETADIKGEGYNVPYVIFNQLGFSIDYSKYFLVPTLFFYGDYRFFINFKNTPFHFVSLSASAVYTVHKKFQLMLGLHWRDRILKPKHSALVSEVSLFHPDQTFLSVGVTYFF